MPCDSLSGKQARAALPRTRLRVVQRGSQLPAALLRPATAADRELADVIPDLSLAVRGSGIPRTERNRRLRMNDLAATFDAHVQAEFQDLDLDATMATMTEDTYVHNLPTYT